MTDYDHVLSALSQEYLLPESHYLSTTVEVVDGLRVLALENVDLSTTHPSPSILEHVCLLALVMAAFC